VLHELPFISYEAESTSNVVPSHGQSQPVQFCGAKFLLYDSLLLTPNSRSQSLQQHESSEKALLSIGSE
jgi:hypothetical protein